MQGSRLFVGNLSYSVTNEDLSGLFATYGDVVEAKVIEGKGFGFVEMSSQSEAEEAKEGLNGTDFSGRSLNVDEAKPPRNRDSNRRY